MKWCRAFFAGITLLASFAWARPEVIFPKEAEVSNTGIISVFQVAEMKEITGLAFTELAKMPLIENEDQEEDLVLSGKDISKKLRELVNNSEALQKVNPSFRIPSQIKIHIRRDGISKQEIERSLGNILLSKCLTCKFDIRVKSIPKVKTKIYEIAWDEDIRGGSFMIPVRESDQFTHKWITGTLKVQKTVPVARRLIRFGERIQTEDIEMMESNITHLKEEPPQASQVVGLVANKSLSAKMPILLSDLKREFAAQRGQTVKAVIGREDFEISINATAEENGFIGDIVKIKNTETQKTMSAVVVDKGVVKIQ